MIRFVDLENHNVFNGSKPYVFWMDGEQSVNLIYIKRICVLSDQESLRVYLPHNDVFQFINMQNVDQYADVTVNDFDYKDLSKLYTYDYESVGVPYDGYFLHMIYIAGQSTSIGELHEDFTLGNESVGYEKFEIGADFYAENEELKINLANFGVEIPESIQNAIYDVNIHEEANDNITLNRKYKELLLQYWDIVANRGSYKSLLNSLSWFEYGNIVQLNEIWKHSELSKTAFSRGKLNTELTKTIKSTLSDFAKTTYIGLYAAMEKFVTDEKEIQHDHHMSSKGFLGEETPLLEALAMKWTREEMSLKMYLLGCFYEAYFMPIHLDLLHSTIEDIVFTNTIKILSANNLGRFDYVSNFDSFDCNVKDEDVFQLGDVHVQAGDMLKHHYHVDNMNSSDDYDDAYKTPMANVIESFVNYDPYLTFIAKRDNSSISLVSLNSHHHLEYSLNKTEWNEFVADTTITLNNEESVYVRGMLEESFDAEYTQFKMTGKIACEGSANNLWNYEDPEAPLIPYCGYSLFRDCVALLNCPSLPSKELADNCYASMFNGCSSLTEAPTLPATEMKDECYSRMFLNCSSLTNVQDILPAMKLANECYSRMFYGCSKLTKAPTLPATELADKCYFAMFYNCTKLVNVQDVLPAMKLATGCYQWMFSRCSKLASVPELPTKNLADYCYSNMFAYCTSLVDGPEILPATKLPRDPNYAGIGGHDIRFNNEEYHGVYEYMFYGCTNLVNAPILPAKQLTTSCYHSMFDSCTKIQKLYILATDIQDQDVDKYIDNLNKIIHQEIGSTTNADAAWLKRNTPTLWMDHSGSVPTRKWYVPTQDVLNQWGSIDTYYTHVFTSNFVVLTPEEYNEILERYHIVYDEDESSQSEKITQISTEITQEIDNSDDLSDYDSYPIFGVESEYNGVIQKEGESESKTIVNDRLKTFMINYYDGVGVVVPIHCIMNGDDNDFINKEVIRVITYTEDEKGKKITNEKTLIKHEMYKCVNGKIEVDFRLLLTEEGDTVLNFGFYTAGGRTYVRSIHIKVLGDTLCKIHLYRVKANPKLELTDDFFNKNVIDGTNDYRDHLIRTFNDYMFSHVRNDERLRDYESYVDKRGYTDQVKKQKFMELAGFHRLFVPGVRYIVNDSSEDVAERFDKRGIQLNYVCIVNKACLEWLAAHETYNYDYLTAGSFDKEDPNYPYRNFDLAVREVHADPNDENSEIVDTYYTFISRDFNNLYEDGSFKFDDLKASVRRAAQVGVNTPSTHIVVIRNEDGFFPQKHYLEELGVRLKYESNDKGEIVFAGISHGQSLEDYTVDDYDTVVAIPEAKYNKLAVNDVEWIFINKSQVGAEREIKMISTKEPFIGKDIKKRLDPGFYDVIFRYKVGSVPHEIRLNSAFRKVDSAQ